MLLPVREPIRHDVLFLERYERLLKRALQLTGVSRADQAEDLVQEAFIRFTTLRPDLSGIGNLDAYLLTVIRNMHLSRARRIRRADEAPLGVLDYDSAERGLLALDPREWLQARGELRAACRYGCHRRLSSKTGSVFLLRFFHGLVPSEIALVLRTAPRVIDHWVRLARREVKLFLTDPGRIALIDAGNASPMSELEPSASSGSAGGDERPSSAEAFVSELREYIFTFRHARCFTDREIDALYANASAVAREHDSGTEPPLDTLTLAEIVTCRACLDRVARRVGLNDLRDRFPGDTLGRNDDRSDGSLPPRRPPAARHRSALRRASEALEHRPATLKVLVNGYLLGTHIVGRATNEFTISVNIDEPIGLVELVSEQDVCLGLLAPDAPPDAPARQSSRSELSDGRYTALSLTFSAPWPELHVVYSDPDLDVAVAVAADAADAAAAAVATPPLERDSAIAARDRLRRWASWLWPQTIATRLAWTVAIAWLLFFTPGTTVSAAEALGRLIVAAVSSLTRSVMSPRSAAPSARPRASADIPLPAAAGDSASAAAGASSPRATASPAALDPRARMRLELEALTRLDAINALLGQEVSLATGSPHRVRIDAIVADDVRKRQVAKALDGLAPSAHVEARIRAMSEQTRAARPVRETVAVRDIEIERDRLPVYDTLRAYFARTGAPDASGTSGAAADADNDARRFATRMLARSEEASRHAWTLQQLATRYADRLRRSPDARAGELWSRLVRAHARELVLRVEALRLDLEPIFRPDNVRAETRPAIASVDAGVDETLSLWKSVDDAVRQAFAVQAGDPGVSTIHTPQFWVMLLQLEALAREVETQAVPASLDQPRASASPGPPKFH